MRTYDVTVTVKPRGKWHARHHQSWTVERYSFDSPLNIRGATIAIYSYFFGSHPRMHWAASGSLGMGQAGNTKRLSRATKEVEVFQVDRMTQAARAAEEIIQKCSQPRLMERRAA